MKPVPLTPTDGPQADHEQPFEWLRACHDRVERTLGLLQRLQEHVAQHGADAQAAEAATQVLRYFDLAAPLHHEDEERHVFPRLLASADARLHALVQRLQADHQAMAADWKRVRSALLRLQAAQGDDTWRWTDDERAIMWRFALRYEGHIAAEEGDAFVAAERAMTAAQRAAMSEDMMRRRAIGSNGTS